jgi:hypothetical protein
MAHHIVFPSIHLPRPALACVLALAMSAGACMSQTAGMPAPPSGPAVVYQSTDLVVEGKTYPRGAAAARSFAEGRLLLTLKPGHAPSDLDALMTRMQLRVLRPLGGTPPIGWVIEVPEGFELQWQAALMQQAPVLSAGVDGRMTTQPVMPGGPGVVH